MTEKPSGENLKKIVRVLEEDVNGRPVEEALRKNEDPFFLLSESLPGYICMFLPDSTITYANSALAAITGRSRDELVGCRFFDLLDLQERDNVIKKLETLTPDNHTEFHEQFYTAPDGSQLCQEWRNRAFFDECGKISHFISVGIDIAGRKQMENALKRSEERYRHIFENAVEGIFRTTPEGACLDANPALARILGYESSLELMSSIFDIGSQAYFDPFRRLEVKRLLSEQGMVRNFEVQLIRKDNEIIWAVINASVIKNAEDNIISYQGTVIDITEKKKLETRLLQAQRIEDIGVLASGIAHDFNNFLAAIHGYIEMAKDDLPYGSRVYNYLITAEKSVQLAAELTKRLSAFSNGEGPADLLCDIGKLVKDTVQRETINRPVENKFIIADNLWPAKIDEWQIRQVIRDLTVNTVEAMRGGGLLTISADNVTVSLRNQFLIPDGPYVRITIQSGGKDVSTKDWPLTFTPLHSIKQNGIQKGMELDLSVCHSIISKHKGCITVESIPGQGNTFHIYLPAVVKEKMPDKMPLQETMLGFQKRILVMDDEEMIRDMMRELLIALGYQVTTVQDGNQAIDLYVKARDVDQSYDIVILDLMVKGGMGGVQTMERLQKIDPQVKAVIFSGCIDDPVIENYRQYGFLGALTKPFKREEIQAILENNL